jgi:hypothetical protein
MSVCTGYFDESSDEENPNFVMGGIILDAENATSFERDWREAIKELPRLKGEPFLHTADFVSGNEQYDPDWKGRYEEKLAILSDAARVISHYSLQTITGVVPHDNIMAANSLNGARNTAKPLSALKSVTCLTGRRSLLTAPGVGGGSGEGELSGGLTSPRAASTVKHT